MLLAAPRSGMSQACYFAAISRVGVAIATLVTICTAPVLVCLFSAALLRERLTRAVVGSLACALIGTVLLIGVGRTDSGCRRARLWAASHWPWPRRLASRGSSW